MNPNDYKLTGAYYQDVSDMEKYEGKIPNDNKIDICCNCPAQVDTDKDDDCYNDEGECWCAKCRRAEAGGYMKRVDVDNWEWTPYETRY